MNTVHCHPVYPDVDDIPPAIGRRVDDTPDKFSWDVD
jgi:hypothetical protein